MNISIIGPGVIGSLWAIKLSQAGHNVSLWELAPIDNSIDLSLDRQTPHFPSVTISRSYQKGSSDLHGQGLASRRSNHPTASIISWPWHHSHVHAQRNGRGRPEIAPNWCSPGSIGDHHPSGIQTQSQQCIRHRNRPNSIGCLTSRVNMHFFSWCAGTRLTCRELESWE